MNDFTTTLEFDQSAELVFEAVLKVRNWWTGDIEGESSSLGDVFTYRYGDLHYSKQEVTEVARNEKVIWHIVDANLSSVDNPKEWVDTNVVFEITEVGGKTQLRFSHNGLVPRFECYEACSNGWGFFINNSLRSLITTAEGPATPPWA